MPINTISVGTAVTPTVIQTYFSHYLNRKPLRQKPTAHLTYHEGLELIRRFLHYASFHTVDEIQAFTSQWVPVPRWIYSKEIQIPETCLAKSAEHIQAQLGPEGVRQVGGKNWWQWRRDNATLKAEWIEMRKDHDERKKTTDGKGTRVMLYVHGGAYYFGSVDEHRYQMQRHARKLKARVLAPRYRLAPQFPFPCGLYDCLAAYLYLLEEKHDPSTIVLAGDSAGGGMVVSMLVTLRDQGIPLPAGAILISPWVDLTHSFPSLGGNGTMDYIPAHGFVHKPSMSWPPPNADDLVELELKSGKSDKKEKSSRPSKDAQKQEREQRVHGFSVTEGDRPDTHSLLHPENEPIAEAASSNPAVGPQSLLSITIDNQLIELKDQIQLYAANHLITHPLVSPVLQPTLGGLPPLLIQVGGGELLRDEQIYLAHKAASPLAHLPPPSKHLSAEYIQSQAAKYRPTNVQLQVWDDLCHVAPTLSFTRPAKYMYRSIAQFGAWALAHAQKTAIDIMDDDEVSVISSSSSTSDASDGELSPDDIKLSMPRSAQSVGFESVRDQDAKAKAGAGVGKAGDPLPPFEKHMIRQRIDRHGTIHPLSQPNELDALKLPTEEIGVIKPGPVRKWMTAQKQWNEKFARQKLKVQKKRLRDMEKGYEGFGEGEWPPPTALAGRRVKGMQKEKAKKKSWGMALWSLWGSKHDEITMANEAKADATPPSPKPHESTANGHSETADGAADTKERNLRPPVAMQGSRQHSSNSLKPSHSKQSRSRSRSRHSTVTDRGQAGTENLSSLAAPMPGFAETTRAAPELLTPSDSLVSPETVSLDPASRPQSPPTVIPDTENLTTRPFRGGVAYPFKLTVGEQGKSVNASMVTLESEVGVLGPASPMSVGSAVTDGEKGKLKGGVKEDKTDQEEEPVGGGLERPGVERFVTAQEGVGGL